MRDAAQFDSRLHMAALKLSAYDASIDITRRTACVVAPLRRFFRFDTAL